ncbi:MAG: nickel pincer cofactor biosynthesis protein LarC [Eubacterium sp.]|nr:nickel pincer cofactor biosynthesis protein LarC [Eubacterium sp.]
MKTLYFECSMGAAGDMLSASLLELLENGDEFLEKLNKIFAPDIVFKREIVSKSGICGTHLNVVIKGEEEGEEHHREHHHEHHHHTPLDIRNIVSNLDIKDKVKEDVLSVYDIIAAAESKVHSKSVSEIHFHEVGALDAVADITAFCLLLDEIGAENIYVSPINLGKGRVKCAHGILPVPAPATAEIISGLGVFSDEINGELTTPTGAALLKRFAKPSPSMPVINIEKTGYGFGKKDFERPNCVRAFLGESAPKSEIIYELTCNIDDMTGEEIAFACEKLLGGGAKDVYTLPIAMKKSRPAVQINVLCDIERKAELLHLMFKHTTTLGIRESVFSRYALEREFKTVSTPYGDVKIKESSGFSVTREKFEFDDLAKLANENDKTIRKIKNSIK